MKLGQQVVCIKKDNWITVYGQETTRNGPKFNEIVTIDRIVSDQKWTFLVFEEYDSKTGYEARHFQPVPNIQTIIQELEICEVSG